MNDIPGPPSRLPASERWSLRTRTLDLKGPAVMGILNLTPDSFSDGGRIDSLVEALDQARSLLDQGADILDVGGESTRPGATPVSRQEEMARVLPFLRQACRELPVPFSIDTRHAEVAEAALEAGVEIVNDVSGLRQDGGMAEVVARYHAGLVLSHMRGTPATMMDEAKYEDVVGEVMGELEGSLDRARGAGIDHERIVVDPGIGFAKTGAQNITLLARLRALRKLGHPLLVGPSRKRFIGALTGASVEDRLGGTIAACVVAYLQGARVFRVHDVGPVKQALRVARAMVEAAE